MKKLIFGLVILAVVNSSCSSTKNLNVMNTLTQNSWVVNSLSGKQLDPSAYLKGLPSMTFGSDGKLTGSTGCNNFTGNFKLDGMSVKLDPGAMTRMACPGNGEADFLSAAQQVTNLKLNGNTLSLLNGADEVMSLIPKK
ncbi:META domain-containing protein [Panacibacter ginsenosidivorans]|uniref:META domain-containing protein n=1 Tax=Panacibacter ginsenosidivorans TaxID=1813871 RepID=A0A5B8VCD2_9BACT|nr:META domain-containing protein [Panacibacter ginsenosidivorans]QEC68601.1 META domain-containing protein [Panacibacter ginsenosidivorans]